MKDYEGITLYPKKIITPVCRASFVKLLKPEPSFNGEPKYSVSLIFPPEADMTVLEEAVALAVKEKWGDKPPANLKLPIKDGNERIKNPEYHGKMYVNANNKRRPQIGERINGAFVEITDAEKVYSGMWVRVTLEAYAFDKQVNKGVSFSLGNVMKVRDDEFLDGRSTGEQDFGIAGLDDSESASYGRENAPQDDDVESLFA